MLRNSTYIRNLQKAASLCYELCEHGDIDNGPSCATKAFFKNYKRLGDKPNLRSTADKHFTPNALQNSIILGFSAAGLHAAKSPRIIFKSEFDFKKYLDILVVPEAGDNQRCVAIEVKSRDFQFIAAGLLQFELCQKFGDKLVAKYQNPREISSIISKEGTKQCLVLGDSDDRSEKSFDILSQCLNNSTTELTCMFPNVHIKKYEEECEALYDNVYNFFEHNIKFLKQGPVDKL